MRGCNMSGRSAVPGTGASMPAVRNPCGLNQQMAVQQMACKTTIIFSTVLKDTVCNGRRSKNKFETFSNNWILNLDFKNWQRLRVRSLYRIQPVHPSGTGWISITNENLGLSEFVWFLRIRVVCYHVAKLHTTMWQSPIKVAGADHAV